MVAVFPDKNTQVKADLTLNPISSCEGLKWTISARTLRYTHICYYQQATAGGSTVATCQHFCEPTAAYISQREWVHWNCQNTAHSCKHSVRISSRVCFTHNWTSTPYWSTSLQFMTQQISRMTTSTFFGEKLSKYMARRSTAGKRQQCKKVLEHCTSMAEPTMMTMMMSDSRIELRKRRLTDWLRLNSIFSTCRALMKWWAKKPNMNTVGWFAGWLTVGNSYGIMVHGCSLTGWYSFPTCCFQSAT